MNNYALIGAHLGHSYSATIHNYIFKKLGIESSYKLIETLDLASFVDYAKANLAGFNVTIPYKEKIVPYLDEIALEAKSLGNVNTVKVINGNLYGYNTDYFGFLEMLKKYHINFKDKSCFVLGSGGAAKTCFNVLASMAKEVSYVSRTKKGEHFISYNDLANKEIDLLVNATPVGMYPNINECPVSDEVLNKAKEVVDLIYNPRQTLFLRAKNSYNNGLLMLILQALKAEEIWEGIKPDDNLIKEVGELFV